MSQTSELLSDDDTSAMTCSDKFEMSPGRSDHGGKLQRQHTEISELSDDSYNYQPLLLNDQMGNEASGYQLISQTSTDLTDNSGDCQCDNCKEAQHIALLSIRNEQLQLPEELNCMCANCVESRKCLAFHHSDHTVQTNNLAHNVPTQNHIYQQGHWNGISISDDEIEIITDSDYYPDSNVFYVDPVVARSLLNEFFVKETNRPSNLHIHVDTRTKRQRFVARAVMIVSMTMFTVSALLVMVSLIMSDKIDELVRGNNNMLQRPSLSTPSSYTGNASFVLVNSTLERG